VSAPDHWTLTPDEVMLNADIPAETRLVFYAFLSYADRDGWCHPKQVTLAARLGMTRQNVAYHLQKLRDRHLLETEKKGKLNHTQVLPPTVPPSIEYVYPIDTSDQTRKWDRRVESERANGIDASDPERVYPVDTDASIPFAPERSHVERKTEYVPEPDLHKAQPAPREPERARAREAPAEKTIDDEFMKALVDEFAPQLGGPAAVGRQIDAALYHRDVTKLVNPQQYLRRALQHAAAGGGR
jgi:DNA-binding transcriptional ArsR family regulator